MDESRYLSLAETTFRAIEAGLDAAEAEVIDCERAGDVLTMTFEDGRRCVINTQRPTRQMWLAANARAWHFDYDEARGRWVDDKGRGEDLFGVVAKIVKEHAGVDVSFSATLD